jgi:putative two-component system response regulator
MARGVRTMNEMAKPRILVVDDEEIVVELHKKLLLKRGYDVVVARNGMEALDRVGQEKPDLILTDVNMPEMNGLELCEKLKNSDETNLIPVVMLTAADDFDNRIRGIETGADDYLAKPVRPRELYARVRSLLRIKSLTDSLESAETVIFSLANAIEAKDHYTRGHIDRVSALAVGLGEFMGVSKDDLGSLKKGGALHDIGKIGIKDTILVKPARLTTQEFEEVKKHPGIGERICRPLHSLKPVLPIIKHHHEKHDGTGYPSGLVGNEIPILARIMSIVDVYDAFTSRRAYRDAMTYEETIEFLKKETEAEKFDRELFEQFQELVRSRPEFQVSTFD